MIKPCDLTPEHLAGAGEILATVNEGRTRVRMRIYDPETGGSRPKPAAFELPRLLDVYSIQTVINLDEQPVALR